MTNGMIMQSLLIQNTHWLPENPHPSDFFFFLAWIVLTIVFLCPVGNVNLMSQNMTAVDQARNI